MEYQGNPKKNAEAFRNGYYHTGDMAWMDEDGYIWFIGRNDDVIKSSGYRIGPFEVESALLEHPAVLEAAITAVPGSATRTNCEGNRSSDTRLYAVRCTD